MPRGGPKAFTRRLRGWPANVSCVGDGPTSRLSHQLCCRTDHQSIEDVLAASLFGGPGRVGAGLRIQWSVKAPFPGTSRRGMWQPTQFAAGEIGQAFCAAADR